MVITVEPLSGNEINLFPQTKIEEVARNVGIIISSPKFSVPLDRDFGTSYKNLDKAINIAQPRLIMEITDAIEQYEKRADIISIKIKTDEAQAGKLIPIVEIGVKDE